MALGTLSNSGVCYLARVVSSRIVAASKLKRRIRQFNTWLPIYKPKTSARWIKA